MTRAVALDFLRTAPALRGWSHALLIIGIAAATAIVWRYTAVLNETVRLEDTIANVAPKSKRELPPLRDQGDLKLLAPEVSAANAVIEELALPWDALFGELEEAATDGVALLSIQPNAAGKEIRITGEARRYADVLTYVQRLEARDALAGVYLTDHEVRQNMPQRPVAFGIVANWVGSR